MTHMHDHLAGRSIAVPCLNRKIAGVMIPLFSIRTNENFGIGEILDLIPLIEWAADHHLHLIQMLPIYETAAGETSPYQALTGFALDPIYLSVTRWEDFNKSEPAQQVWGSPAAQENLREWRESPVVRYESIRPFKNHLLRLSFERFKKEEWEKKSARAKSFQRFMDEKAAWLDDYAIFRLLKEDHGWVHWIHWPLPLKNRDQAELKKLKEKETDRILFLKYLQWALAEQWKQAREHARTKNILLMGDLPFMVSRDSADVWSQQEAFSAEDSVGAPPDAFSETGQDWGLPLFLWKVMETQQFLWWRRRIREVRETYDLIRLDHVVGFYRVWVIPKDKPAYFEPQDEEEQVERGKALLRAIAEEAGPCIPVAEDLGVIPDFVHETLAQFRIAGHKVLRWQKVDTRYHDPKQYPFISLATSGTHDTSPLVLWWEEISPEERAAFLTILGQRDRFSPDQPFSNRLHEAILDLLMASGSNLVVLPVQDILGVPEQINVPATVGRHNWRYRLPAPLQELTQTPSFKENLLVLRNLIDRHRRYAGPAPLITP